MAITPQTQAILLLTSHFSKASNIINKPLTPAEWGRFAHWLKEHNLNPEFLITNNFSEVMKGWDDPKITLARLNFLLARGTALALAIEKWTRASIWILTRSDAEYPQGLKKHLGINSPPVLYGCGNKTLLNQGGLAVVGSRNINDVDIKYADQLGRLAAREGYSVISGGARGVDETSMLGALSIDGTSVGILADSLLKACISQKYRKSLMNNNLVLVSSYFPEAGFNVGNAMGRNKYIYCLSHAAVVVHTANKGGTWTGAIENLNKKWVPLWVKPNLTKGASNKLLVEKGARWLNGKNPDSSEFSKFFRNNVVNTKLISDDSWKKDIAMQVMDNSTPYRALPETYDSFNKCITEILKAGPKSKKDLTSELGIKTKQFNIWIKKAVEKNIVDKLTRPVMYQLVINKKQLDIPL